MAVQGVIDTGGVFCPLITPFDHSQEIYTAKLIHNLSRLNLLALSGYVVGSPTGEAEMLSDDELLFIVRLVAQNTSRPLVAATAKPGVAASVRFLNAAADLGYVAAIHESADEFLRQCIADRIRVPLLPLDALQAPALANVVPYAFLTIHEAERTREPEAAADWRSRMKPAARLIEKHGIAGLKSAMDKFGFYGGHPRLPRVPVTASAAAEIADAFLDLPS